MLWVGDLNALALGKFGGNRPVQTDKGMVPTGLFIEALNEMMGSQDKRLNVIRERVPNIVSLTLYGIAATANAFARYASGLGRRPSRLPIYVMIALICGVLII